MVTEAERNRHAMVEAQLVRRGIHDSRVLDAFRAVPRERFMPPGLEAEAWYDGPIEIGHGQTISQPYVVALMMQAAGIRPQDSVLDVGTGSGYAAAIADRLAARVVSIERIADLAASARRALDSAGAARVEVVIGDGSAPPGHDLFDVILVAAAGPRVPASLTDRLAPGGRLVMPVGSSPDSQMLVRVVRQPDGRLVEDAIDRVSFVPLIGRGAWAGPAG
jgi:protein-L-isoaspartate(D-aspartate) O-methyltransferase